MEAGLPAENHLISFDSSRSRESLLKSLKIHDNSDTGGLYVEEFFDSLPCLAGHGRSHFTNESLHENSRKTCRVPGFCPDRISCEQNGRIGQKSKISECEPHERTSSLPGKNHLHNLHCGVRFIPRGRAGGVRSGHTCSADTSRRSAHVSGMGYYHRHDRPGPVCGLSEK